jgi:hypothetical protein
MQVLATPRVRGSRMLINPTLAKQGARRVCVAGVPLWRYVAARAAAVAAQAAAEGMKTAAGSAVSCLHCSYAGSV